MADRVSLATLALAKKYTNEIVEGGGVIKGKNCVIDSIEPITGGNRITFMWTLDDGTVETDTLDVMDGAKGDDGADGQDGADGVGITNIAFKEKDAQGNNVYTITMSNSDTYDFTSPKGDKGADGDDGTNGFSPTITVKENTSERYVLTITDVNGSYDTPNLKGTGGGGGASALTDLTDVNIVSLANGQVLIYDSATGKWVNSNLPTMTVDSALSTSSENPVQNKVIALTLEQLQGSMLSLGESSGTAYEGSKGKANADNIAGIQEKIPSGASSSNKLATANDLTTKYDTGDTAETDLADGDYVPFYDTSATAKRKTLWSNIKSVLKTYFDTLYAAVNHTHALNDLSDTTITTPTADQVLKYNGSKWVNGSFSAGSLAGLSDVDLSSPADKQLLTYDYTNQKWINADMDKSFVRYGGSTTFASLTSSLLVAANEDKFFLVTDGGTISNAALWTSAYSVGDVIPADAHIAVINVGTAANPDYRFDDFGGYVDISGKADATSLDGWTAAQTLQVGDTTKTFTGLNTDYAYVAYFDCADGYAPPTLNSGIIFSGTSATVNFSAVTADQAGSGGNSCKIKLRIIK